MNVKTLRIDLLSVGRRDRYIAHMWDDSTSREAIEKFSKEHKLPISTLPTLVVQRDGILDVHKGTEVVRLAIRDMV